MSTTIERPKPVENTGIVPPWLVGIPAGGSPSLPPLPAPPKDDERG